jgi:hypothetical protein
MNKKQKNNLIIAVFVLAFLLLIRKSKNDELLNGEENVTDDKISEQVVLTEEQNKKKEPYLYDWKQNGSKDDIVKLIQKRFYMTLKMVSNYFKNNESFEYDTWQHDIYNLYKHNPENFKIDGIWGKKTSLVSKVITGNTGSSLDIARKKYLDLKGVLY